MTQLTQVLRETDLDDGRTSRSCVQHKDRYIKDRFIEMNAMKRCIIDCPYSSVGQTLATNFRTHINVLKVAMLLK